MGLRYQSNLDDQYDKVYTQALEPGQDSSGSPQWKVKGLFIYPIKSCAPVELDNAHLDGSGLCWDRKFAFAELLTPVSRPGEATKKPEWTFRTQRTPGLEKLALVKPEVWLPHEKQDENSKLSGVRREGVLVVKYPNVPSGPLAAIDRLFISLGFLPQQRSFQVPLLPPADHAYPVEDVIIWKDTPKWLNYGTHLPDDFKAFLGVKHPLTLFRVAPGSERQVLRCAPRKELLGYQSIVGFADAYPVHLLNLSSVRNIGARVKEDIPHFSAMRFRPNILLTGPAAFDEDDWKRVRVGKHDFFCACHTVRCRLPNVDPQTSERHPHEPDKTLKSFRCIDDGDPKNACLGLQLVPAHAQNIELRVGDAIDVHERGEHHYIKQ